jgi:hypothetical protein
MSQDDDVERVARAIYEAGPLIRNYRWRDLSQFTQSSFYAQARAALSAMPQRELLREALEALDALISAVDVYEAEIPEDAIFATAYIGARAAADKIRAALTQEKQA